MEPQQLTQMVRRLLLVSSQRSGWLKDIFPELDGYRLEPVSSGKTSAEVFSLTCSSRPNLFLKMAQGSCARDLADEYERMTWLRGRVPVPEVVGFERREEQAFLLTRALSGINAAEMPKQRWSSATDALAEELRRVHSVEPSDCPFDRTLHVIISSARIRTERNVVDESEFDERYRGCSAQELLNRLDQEKPQSEDLVVTHGDACLSNAILHQGLFSGFVDCGRSGIADRYQDLALASRSIQANYGPEYVERFYLAYGLQEIDEAKVSYYRMADEFF